MNIHCNYFRPQSSSSAATPIASALVSVLAGFMSVALLFKVSAVLCIVVFALMGVARVRLSNEEEEESKDSTEKLPADTVA